MTDRPRSENATRRLHKSIYALAVGFAVWLAVSAWAFSGPGPTDYVLAVVSGFIFVSIALPSILSHIRRPDFGGAASAGGEPLSEWLRTNFDTWQARLKGWDAAAEALLPLAAAAFGMTAIGIVFLLVRHSVG